MSKLRLSITMSVDGYVGGPDQSHENPLWCGRDGAAQLVLSAQGVPSEEPDL